ncbi:MAG: cofactor assembly of complex C subunit B [Synechococcus sp.]
MDDTAIATDTLASAQLTTVSTLIMTVLLLVGLFFFIRASGKDRTEIRRYLSQESVEEVGQTLRGYLNQRSYQIVDTDETGLATFVGQARPSGFLTGLLSLLAGVGLLCLALVLQVLKPELGGLPYFLILGAPFGGWYYRKKSTREETLKLRVSESEVIGQSTLDIQGHRDELNLLPELLQLEEIEA